MIKLRIIVITIIGKDVHLRLFIRSAFIIILEDIITSIIIIVLLLLFWNVNILSRKDIKILRGSLNAFCVITIIGCWNWI